MNSKLACIFALTLFAAATGCATTSTVDAGNGGSVPGMFIAGHDTSSDRGVALREPSNGPIGRDDDRGTAHRAPALHETLVCARCR